MRLTGYQCDCCKQQFANEKSPVPFCRGFIIWDKITTEDLSFAMCEYAWTSFDCVAKIYRLNIQSENQTRFHPTQKPVALYKWVLKNYAKEGDKIIDTHSGSGTLAIACIDRGFEYLCIEKDKEYFEKSVERVNKELIKINMFD